MVKNQLLSQLEALKKQKLSKAEYAKKLGITLSQVEELFKELKQSKTKNNASSGNEKGSTVSQNREDGTASAEFTHSSETMADEEIYKECNLCPKRWKITQIWKSKTTSGFKYSANFKLKDGNEIEDYIESFKTFLKNYKSPHKAVKAPAKYTKPNASVLIPKQDFHFDKRDTSDNDLISRRSKDLNSTLAHIDKACHTYNVEKVFYVLGSDYFNSEFTKATTKGTPQQNVGEYHEIFEQACNHEVAIISEMLEKVQNIEVIFIPGNHDYYKCWHLVTWLEAYFRNEPRVIVNTDKSLRKYIKYSNTAVMLHHGNEIKPQMLANIFPAEFKESWSDHKHFFIVTGDKHREMINDFGNIRHYGVKALSSSKSFWDEQLGYISGGEYTTFVIVEDQGIKDIYK